MLILLDRLHMIQVYFITEEGHDRQPLALERPLHQLMPILQILERLLVCYIVRQHHLVKIEFI